MVDWRAVPYPPWWIERAAERMRLLDRAVARLRAVVATSQDLVGALVFGSYATNSVGPESDLDVIVVTNEPANGDPGGRHARIAARLQLEVPCDLIVYEAETFARLALERPFVAQARAEGLWIDAATPA